MGRQAFLSCIGGIYFIAFASYYIQYPGLLGTDGLEPSDAFLQRVKGSITRQNPALQSPQELFQRFPVLSWYLDAINDAMPEGAAERWHVDDLHEGLCLLGMFLSLICFLGVCRHAVLFLLLWLQYLTLQKTGQTFLGFQWDILLLEVGWVAIFYAPWLGRGGTKAPIAWVLRWCLFKLMLMAGVVKLQSRCSTWLKLTALEYHYATQCLPSPLAYWSHQLHPFLQRFSVASTLVIEIPAALLLVSPLLAHRRVGAVLQIFLQILIILTGNYTYFNALTMILCIPVWASDYEEEAGRSSKRKDNAGAKSQRSLYWKKGPFVYLADGMHHLEHVRWWGWLTTLTAWAFVTASFSYMITIKSTTPPLPHMEHWAVDLTLTVDELNLWLERGLLPVIMTVACLLCFSGVAYLGHRARHHSWLAACRALAVSIAALCLFGIAVVPVTHLHQPTMEKLPVYVMQWYQRTQPYGVSSGYGLFRTMTGVGRTDPQSRGWGDRPPSMVARPEIILEGFDGQEWHEIHFRYKPGCTTCPPKFVAPHQPRLDWQMWFAALGSYQNAPWFIHLVDKLLEGSDPVIRLLDTKSYCHPQNNTTNAADQGCRREPFQEIRARLYTYDFTRLETPWSERLANTRLIPSANASVYHGVSQYWHRSTQYRDYLPGSMGRHNPSVKHFLAQYGWAKEEGGDKAGPTVPGAEGATWQWSDKGALALAALRLVRRARQWERGIDALEYQYPVLLAMLIVRLQASWQQQRSRVMLRSPASSK